MEPTHAGQSSPHVSLHLGDAPLEVVSLRGEHRLSRLFSFQLVCRAVGEGAGAANLVGQEAEITLRDGFGAERSITGICAEAAVETHDDGSTVTTVDVRPEVYPLTLGRGSRVFQDSSVVDIAQAVLRGKRVRLSLTRSYPVRVYTAQYREDDWSFLCRLLEEEGIYAWFDHAGPTTLVLSDDSTSAPDLAGGAHVPFHHETGMTAGTELIEELGSEVTLTPTRFTVSSFDPARPALQVEASVGQGALEIYHAPGGGPESPAICAARAATMQQAAAAAGAGVRGLTTSVRLVPGMVMEVGDHPLAALDGRYLVTEVAYEVSQERRFGGAAAERPYACRFRAIRAAASYRPPAETRPARQAGLQTGVVVGPPGAEIHTHAAGTARVQHHWDRQGKRDDRSGKWMRVAQRGTGDSMLLPRVGWTVLTFNEEGAADAPSVLSRIHDGEHLPPYGLPGNKTRVVWKTATSPGGGAHNEIYFEDTSGAEEMFINASKDHDVRVLNVKREAVGRDSVRAVGVDHALTVGEDKMETVGEDLTVTIHGDQTIDVKGNSTTSVGINETSTISGSRDLHAASSSVKVTGSRRLDVGTALLDITLGKVSASAGTSHSFLVGGAVAKIAGKSISESAGKVAVQTILGVKLEYARAGRLINVNKSLYETVGGDITLCTQGTFDNLAVDWEAHGVGELTASAPTVLVQAKEKIELHCGNSVITISSTGVEAKAPTIEVTSSADWQATAKLVKIN